MVCFAMEWIVPIQLAVESGIRKGMSVCRLVVSQKRERMKIVNECRRCRTGRVHKSFLACEFVDCAIVVERRLVARANACEGEGSRRRKQ